MCCPDPCPGESEQGGEEVSAVVLGEGNNLRVSGRIQEEGDKFLGRHLEGGGDYGGEEGVGGQEVAPVLEGGGEGGGQGRTGTGQEMF